MPLHPGAGPFGGPFGSDPGGEIGARSQERLRIQTDPNVGKQFGLEPGLSFEEWAELSGITTDTPGAEAGFAAYQELTGPGDGSIPPAAPQFSLRIDQERTGAGDLRINV